MKILDFLKPIFSKKPEPPKKDDGSLMFWKSTQDVRCRCQAIPLEDQFKWDGDEID